MAYDAVHDFALSGHPTESERELYAALRPLHGAYRVKVTRARKRHTSPQQRYYWGVVVPHVAACLKEASGAKSVDKDDAHYAMKLEFLRLPVNHPETGERLAYILRGSSSLDVGEYAEFVESVIGWLWHNFDVSVPAPSTQRTEPTRAAVAAGK